jgi:hypothetical protein
MGGADAGGRFRRAGARGVAASFAEPKRVERTGPFFRNRNALFSAQGETAMHSLLNFGCLWLVLAQICGACLQHYYGGLSWREIFLSHKNSDGPHVWDWYNAAPPADRRRILVLYSLAMASAFFALLEFIGAGLTLFHVL